MMTNMNSNRSMILKSDLYLFLLFFPCFMPRFFTTYLIGTQIYDLLLLVELGYLIVLNIYKNKEKITGISFIFFLIGLTLLFLTVLNGGYLALAVYKGIPVINTALIFLYYQGEFLRILKVLLFQFEFYIYGNLGSLLFFSRGIYNVSTSAYGSSGEWLLQGPSEYIYWLYPAAFIAILNMIFFQDKKSIRRSICLIIGLGSTFFFKSSTTGKVGIILMIGLYFLLEYIIRADNKVIALISSFSMLFLYISIVIIQRFDYLYTIVVNMFKKDMTMTHRLVIWEGAINAIRKNFLGYGAVSSSTAASILGRFTANHCHNHYLQITFTTGIEGLILFLIAEIMLIVQTVRSKNDKLSKAIICAIFAFNIMGITESLDYASVYLVFLLAGLALKDNFDREAFRYGKIINTLYSDKWN